MDRNLHEVFKDIAEIEPTQGLESRIFQAVAMEEDRAVRRKLLVSRLGLGVSMAVFLAAVSVFGNAILQSEFWNLVSLVFSDMWVVAQNWNEFAYSLMETFPTVSVAAILAPVMILLFSFSVYLEANHKHKYI
ncbi:MAG: hypothetical protein Q8L11_03425 [Candidatus Moranbacteria bacterium]|nr:hypothetical protein [Candidatus Moranbacteria bacterium]